MDPDSKQLLEHFFGGAVDVKPIDLTSTLPRHPTKKHRSRRLSDIKMIVVHTTNWETTPEKLAQYDITPYFIVKGKKIYNHISKTGCPAITYHEGIMKDGVIYKTLPWEEESWHAGSWNKQALGVACYYKTQNKAGEDVYAPPLKMMQSLWCRVGTICLSLGLTPDKVVGHRELKGTGWFWQKGSKRLRKTCPGLLLDLDLLRLNVAKLMQVKLKTTGCYLGEIDGDFGPLSRGALWTWRGMQ